MCSRSRDNNDGVEIAAILSVLITSARITNANLPFKEKI